MPSGAKRDLKEKTPNSAVINICKIRR